MADSDTSSGSTSTGAAGQGAETSDHSGLATGTLSSSPGDTTSSGSESPDQNSKLDAGWKFLAHPDANKIRTTKKFYDGQSYHSFVDGLGREVHFRGWNTSGSVKLVETGFKPFKNPQDAQKGVSLMRAQAGSNIARFTLAWEGVHTGPDQIDTAYLDAIIAQMREAISRKIYVFLDYHADLYSRHTFPQDSKNTGNGAPKWIVQGGDHGTDNCGLPCDITWSAHKLSDDAVRSAMRAFWLNAPVETPIGTRRVQTEFLWQIQQTASYIKSQLSEQEFDFVLGIEPLNEPFDGGIKELGLRDYKAFDNELLWPFYQRMRTTMSQAGWQDKWVFAEPMVFWSSQAGVMAPATGGGFLDQPPGPGFVFSPHFYDQGRQGVNNLRVARNGAYFADIDKIRDEARFLDLPVLLTEFGMWIEGHGHTDTQRVINNVYQSLESSDRTRSKDRYLDFFTPLVGATQWHWDIYFDNHHEYQNGNLEKLLTKDDAWNQERYSVLNDYGKGYNVGQNLIERAYPRRVQGQLLQFSYHAKVRDVEDQPLDWHSIRISDAPDAKRYFQHQKFIFASWMSLKPGAPTEIFLPRHIDPQALTIVTPSTILHAGELSPSSNLQEAPDEIALLPDSANSPIHGHRLFVWDKRDLNQKIEEPTFLLIVEQSEVDPQELLRLQSGIRQRLAQRRSPVFLTGRMTKGGYPLK